MQFYRKRDEIKYLKDYIWMYGCWWRRTITEYPSHVEGLTKVGPEVVPEVYFKYYEELIGNGN